LKARTVSALSPPLKISCWTAPISGPRDLCSSKKKSTGPSTPSVRRVPRASRDQGPQGGLPGFGRDSSAAVPTSVCGGSPRLPRCHCNATNPRAPRTAALGTAAPRREGHARRAQGTAARTPPGTEDRAATHSQVPPDGPAWSRPTDLEGSRAGPEREGLWGPCSHFKVLAKAPGSG
jgi:hypothetical protein